MASIGDLVQAKSGLMYDKDSPQGKTIVNAQKRAAASAAQSNSFSAGSSALNTADATPILNNIADDVEIIRNSVNQLVVIAEADARGDALGSANVTEDATVTAMTGDGGTNVVSDAESAEAAGGLGGLAGMIAGDSAIATVGLVGAGLMYRGYDINELSEKSTFEEVYYLLLYERLPPKQELDKFVREIAAQRYIPMTMKQIIEQLPFTAHPMDLMRCVASVMGTLEPENLQSTNQTQEA